MINKFLFVTTFLLLSFTGFSQVKDTLIKKLDSLSHKTDSAGGQQNNTTERAYNTQTKITFKNYFVLMGSNLKQEFTKPFHMTGKNWGQLGMFALATTALSFADEPIQKQALKFRNTNSGALKVSKFITNSGGIYEFYTLGAIGAYGFIFKNEKVKTTTLLATQAYISGTVVESVLKFVTGRTRPSFYDPTVEAEPTFKGPFAKTAYDFSGTRSNSSFPSGHATVAFAAATVFAMEYKSTVWVPVFSYTAASLISISRITENKHWATDVFVGAALGYLTGRQIVNNYHRYAKIKSPGLPKNSVTFNVQYHSHQITPGVVYHIR
jgi:membrane-associated phospholipid phosphatase